MIKHLSGNYETVEYTENSSIILYDNKEDENFPIHWHNALEIIMPLQNGFTVCTNKKIYNLKERDIIIIPAGELHSLESPRNGQRLIFQCDNSVLGGVKTLVSIIPLFSDILYINDEFDSNLTAFAKKTMFNIYDEYYSKSELKEVNIYIYLIKLLVKLREFQIKQNENKLSFDVEKNYQYSEKFNLVLKCYNIVYFYRR